MTRNLRKAAGSLLIVGLGGTELAGLERAWLRLIRPGGIILFKRNISDPFQTRAMLAAAADLCAADAMRCVDVEGGTVNRLREALAALPSAQAVAAAVRKLDKPDLAYEHGALIARAVAAFGFNTTLAPVLDLALPEAAEVLGSRPAGADAAEAIAYAGPFLQALADAGIAGCGKHFPGLGGACRDSHLVTPKILRPFRQIWNEDLRPYRELQTTMPIIMIGHAAYPASAGRDLPASVSAFWIAHVLRKRIGYRGIVLSDDLEMGGILDAMPIEQAALGAIRAGADVIEICHSPELILRAYEALIAEAERSGAFRALLLSRARELAQKRQRLYSAGTARALTARQLAALRERMIRFCETVAGGAGDAAISRAATLAETS